MKYDELLYGRFSEPAAILSYKDDRVRIIDLNEKFISEMWVNAEKKDFLSDHAPTAFDRQNLQIFVDAVIRCVQTGEDQIVETWRSLISVCCGYDKICLRSRLVFVETNDGESIIYERIVNITNEKMTADTLADVEYRYKQTSEQVNIYNWEYDVATKEMRPCYRCMRDLGLPSLVTDYPEPAIAAGIFPPDYADMYRDMMHKVDAGVAEIEADIPLTVGRVPFRVKYTTEFDNDGKPVKAFGSATLISETELGHIKLDNQIIESLAGGYSCIYLADFVSREVKVIKQEEIFAFDEKVSIEDILKSVAAKLSDVAKEEAGRMCDVGQLRSDVFADCDRREFSYKEVLDDKWIRIEYHVIERSNDKVDRLLITAAVMDDIQAQKMDADRLIATQKEELESRQTMLINAIDEANRANQAKTEFFSNMSHDIRTPMSAITGFSRLAKDELDNREHVEDYLDKIVSAGDHLMNLINDILDMSRIESGKMEISPTPVKIKDLLSKSADMVRVKMEENKLDFIVDTDEVGDDTVMCDSLRFDQVILNLLSNAYKFTSEGGKVTLSGRLKERKENLVYEITVKDTGIGMSKEFAEHIWEAYSRENSQTVHGIQGTGLGMVIVHSIINLMKGTIELRTKPHEGSEFIITLPVKAATEENVKTETDRQAEDAINRSYEGVTILVVDDTMNNLRLAERILGKYGFTVRTADSGISALKQISESKPGDIDLVLMDVQMPVMDGYEATGKIRKLADPALSQIPVIAMTANAFESDIQAAFDAGMNGHIAKPFLPKDLITKISLNLK
ncbi:MAG: response regulator [Lachnospiraceae bacterium]|nr:response regulator [Lachnospiraceae bacterium]